MDRPTLDESLASEYVGKTILIGVTQLDHDKKLIGRQQWFGTILTFPNKDGIRIKLRDSDAPCALLPDPRGIQKAMPGVYRLESTGEEVTNPDDLVSWTRIKPKPVHPNS
jgi:hypothetical protein